MMRCKKRKEKGISLISLVIAVTLIIILTNVMIYNMKNNLVVGKLQGMQNDIENLQDKVSAYYAQYGKIPASVKYTNIDEMKSAGIISNAVDTGEFYVLDLGAIENVTLNYGQDYETVKSMTDSEEVSQYTDLYIINQASHNIFYPRGIEIDGEKLYTNYTSRDVDTEEVVLHYVENVKIPDGYKYVNGTKTEGIIIQDEATNEQYTWVVLNKEILAVPEGLIVENEEEFIKSVNVFNGYYQATEDSTKGFALTIEEKWSPVYDKNGKYVDENEDTAIIPAGFKVSQTPGTNTIEEGLVIQDEEGNQFVWVPVEPDEFKRLDWENWSGTGEVTELSEDYIENEENDPTGEYAQMKTSIETNHGFYIARFEAGKETIEGIDTVVSKKGQTVWNNIAWGDSITEIGTEGAVYRSLNFVNDTYTSKGKEVGVKSTLVYGIQWDAVMRWLSKDNKLKQYITDSNEKGNYLDDDDTNNPAKTGANDEEQMKNIYDIAGNVQEWTMEAYNTNYRIYRGGSYDLYGNSSPVSSRINNYLDYFDENLGFRVALYL